MNLRSSLSNCDDPSPAPLATSLVSSPLVAGVLALAVAGVALLMSSAIGQEAKPVDEPAPAKFSYWMNVKVEESQKVFAALAMADFQAIEDSCKKLESLNALENFVRRTTPGYQTQLRSFEFAVDEVRRQAKHKNIEGVAMGFHQLTLSCVNCHKQIRGSAPPPSKP